MEVRRIAVRDVRTLVVVRGLTALCLPGSVWWKTSVLGKRRAETRLEGGERSRSCDEELLCMGLQLQAAMGAV